ncbi:MULTISPECIES: recombinase family protein [Cytobacillus]|uniref:recombinase family protein n=1 Tax=Cytobacillus TaxID=2675230 RepID=UPI00203E480F|nr:recombinase family protein [Cytobacillus firmus]MCM3705197.1 recombinase family protein [Cytobacillus firmus]
MTVANMVKSVGVYLRISRESGEGRDTLLSHRTIAERYCRDKGYSYKIYEEVISGAKDIEERQSLNQLLIDIQMYEAIFVISTDRISRDNYYTQYVAKVLADNDVYILTPEKLYDLNGDDRLMFDMLGAMSSQELRLIAKRQKRGKREGAKRGEWVQGVPPLGYTRGKEKKLEIIESEANLVRMIFNYAESGYGIQSIVTKLEGHKTKAGNQFTNTAIYTILNNKTYTGSIIYNIKDKKGKITETIVMKNAHEAIITNEQFKSVQQAIKGRMSGDMDTRNRSKGKVLSMLKDLLYCKECGLKMGFRKDSKQKDAIYLKSCKCGNRGIVEHQLITSFISEFEFLQGFYQNEWENALKSSQSVSKDTLLQQVAELNKSQDKLNTRLSRAKDAYLDGVFSKEEYLKSKNDIEAELTKLSNAINDLQEQVESMDKDSISSEYKSKIEKIEQFYKLYNKEDSQQYLEECNRILKLIINKVYYARVDEKVTITSPLEGYTEVEQGDFVDLFIESK